VSWRLGWNAAGGVEDEVMNPNPKELEIEPIIGCSKGGSMGVQLSLANPSVQMFPTRSQYATNHRKLSKTRSR
jgi:hypothetical protein